MMAHLEEHGCATVQRGRNYPAFPLFIANMFGSLNKAKLAAWLKTELKISCAEAKWSDVWTRFEAAKVDVWRAQQSAGGCGHVADPAMRAPDCSLM
tara:strand:- start:143 stop:430 length:288 start_codon:yes stop_codon:yes gene_type:complete